MRLVTTSKTGRNCAFQASGGNAHFSYHSVVLAASGLLGAGVLTHIQEEHFTL